MFCFLPIEECRLPLHEGETRMLARKWMAMVRQDIFCKTRGYLGLSMVGAKVAFLRGEGWQGGPSTEKSDTFGMHAMKSGGIRLLVGLGFVVSTAASWAAPYTWNFDNVADGLYSQIQYNGLTVKAYQTSNTNGTGTLSSTNMQIRVDGQWGLGILSPDEGAYPDNYTIDNTSKDEVLVFDAGAGNDNFDWTSLKIGFVYTGTGADPSPILTYLASNTNPSGTADYGTLIGGGKELSISGGGTKTLTEKNVGRYLMVSGDLGASGGFDKFKISTVSGQTPEPQSLALLGIGVLAMLGMGSRAKRTAFV